MRLGIDLRDVESEHGGGKDRVAFNLIRGLVQLGHAPEIVCYCREHLAPMLYAIDPGLTVVAFPEDTPRNHLVRLLRRRRSGRRIRQAAGADVDVLLFANKFTPRLRYPVRTAFITHDLQCFAAPLGRQSLVHALRRLWERRWIRSDAARRDLVIAISEYDAWMCRQYLKGAEKKVRRIYDPIRFEDGQAAESAAPAIDNVPAPAIDDVPETAAEQDGSPGHITALNIQWEHKNTLTLIKAFGRVKDALPLDLVLVGKVPTNYPALQAYVREHDLTGRVRFTGFIPEEELAQIVDRTRIYVNPSLFEGFGMTAVEMLGRGIPTIVAEDTALPEVTLGYARTYSPAKDDEALAAAILTEWREPTPDAQRDAAAKAVRAAYDHVKIAAAYWEALSGLADGTAAQGVMRESERN